MSDSLGARLRRYAEKDGRGYPDWAVRYVPVVRRLRNLGKCGGTGRSQYCLLEIGANENGFARFANVHAVVTDVAIEHLRAARATQNVTPVVADIAALPFRDGTFDVCICMDTFEHLAKDVRDGAARQIVTVIKPSAVAVVGFPSGEASARAEQEVQQAYRAFTGRTLHWLEEHAAQGLPEAEDVHGRFRELAGAGWRVVVMKNANLCVWRWMWRVLMCGWPGRGNAVFQVLLRMITPLLTRMHFGSCYRTMIWLEPK